MRVADIMTPDPVTVTVDQSVADAVKQMRDRRIRHLPVLRDGALVGILTDRDVRWLLGQYLGGRGVEHADAMGDVVGDVMTADPVTVRVDDAVPTVVDLLVERRIGGLPVVDAGGRLAGIVTYVDVLRACRELLRRG